jgi:outer membrane murein-binding lipoprotein Lpp
MRVFSLAVALLMLAGCQKNFDEQYAETEQRLKARAEKLDKEMAKDAAKEAGQSRP